MLGILLTVVVKRGREQDGCYDRTALEVVSPEPTRPRPGNWNFTLSAIPPSSVVNNTVDAQWPRSAVAIHAWAPWRTVRAHHSLALAANWAVAVSKPGSSKWYVVHLAEQT